MTSTALPPADVELIAAFIDGRLSGDERQAFVDRLERDESLYEVFTETARFRAEQAGDGATVVAPAFGRQTRRWLMPAAAAAVLAVAVAAPLLLRGNGTLSVARLGGALAGGLEGDDLTADWFEPLWSVTRGPAPSARETGTAFRLGVRSVDLELALRAGREQDAITLTHRIEALLQGLDFSEPIQIAYADLRQRTADGTPLDQRLELSEFADSLLPDLFPELTQAHDFGKWCEAGRLAAESGNAKLMRSRSFSRQLRQLREHPWDEPVPSSLDRIEELLEAPAGQLDLAALRAAFEAILSAA